MKNRIITAIIIALVLIPLLLIGGIPYLVGIVLLSGLVMYELTKASKANILVKVLSIAYAVSYTIYAYFTLNRPFYLINALLIMIPFISFFIIQMFDKKGTFLDAIYDSLFVVIISLFAHSALELRYALNNANLVGYLILVTCAVDVFALLFGVKLGKHRLNERISPKKSIEGSLFGMLFGLIIGTVFTLFFPIFNEGTYSFLNLSVGFNFDVKTFFITLAITFLLTIVGQLGDLVFSMVKRHYGIKDYSNILPGHGGFVDRIDSLTLNSIVLTLIVSLMGLL